MNITKRDPISKVRIISYSREPFQSRSQAGHLLALELSTLKNKRWWCWGFRGAA